MSNLQGWGHWPGLIDFDASRVTLTVLEAADTAHVKRRTIYNWLQRGLLQYSYTISGNVRIYEDSLFRKVEAR